MSGNEKTYQTIITITAVVFSPIAYLISLGSPQFRFLEIYGLGLFQIAIMVLLELESNSRKIEGNLIIYNRKEWPLYFYFFINTGIAYFLYSKINIQTTSTLNYYFGLSYVLIVLLFFNIRGVLYRIKNRNDYVKIDSKSIYIKDNKNVSEFSIKSLKSIEKESINIKLNFKDAKTFVLSPTKLGLSHKDKKNIIDDLNSIIEC